MTSRCTSFLSSVASIAFLAACAGSQDLPSAPNLTAHRFAAERSEFPSPRGYLLFVHDPVKDRSFLVGGISGLCTDLACDNALIDDLWSFNPSSRTWREVANVLPPREGDAAALDYRSRQIIMYQPFFNNTVETWAYDIDKGTWEDRRPAVEPPARWGSMMVYDSKADRALLYGGADLFTGDVLGDLWAYDYETNTWTKLQPAVSPPPHHFSGLVYVPTIDRVILFGGYQPGFTSLYNDTWAYDYRRNRWTNLHPKNPPAPRVYHTMAFEAATNRIVIFGGVIDENNPDEPTTNETWIYDVAANRWSQVFPKNPPSPRAWQGMSWTNGPVVIFGGGPSRDRYTNDTFLYDSRSNRWEQVTGDFHNDARERNVATVRSMSGGRGSWNGSMLHRH
jgi:hypothetical protein